MKIFGLTTKSIELASRSLDFIADSTSQVSSNLANISTPRYNAADSVNFEDTFADAFRSEKEGGVAKSNPRHFPITDLNRIHPATFVHEEDARIDGNTVDLDKEGVKLALNSIKYLTYSTIASKDLGKLKMAIGLTAQ